MSVAMAVVERNWRRFIALGLDLVGIGTLHMVRQHPPNGARIRLACSRTGLAAGLAADQISLAPMPNLEQ
jgi:hypothetical protein